MAYAIPLTDRRANERVVTPIMLEYRVGNQIGCDLTYDLSETGLFLCTGKAAAVGRRIFMTLHLGAQGTLRMLGTVVRAATLGKAQLPGVGVRFEGLYSEDRLTLQRFISTTLRSLKGLPLQDEVETQLQVPTPTFAKPQRIRPRAELSIRRVERHWVPRDISLELRKTAVWLFYWALIIGPVLAAYFILKGVLVFLDSVQIGI